MIFTDFVIQQTCLRYNAKREKIDPLSDTMYGMIIVILTDIPKKNTNDINVISGWQNFFLP